MDNAPNSSDTINVKKKKKKQLAMHRKGETT